METKQLALLLVDIQRDFWRAWEKSPQFKSFPENIRTLLSVARTHRLSVIHIQSVFRADRSDWMLFYRPQGRCTIPCISGSSGVNIEDFAMPQDAEPIICKQTFDGFLQTDLEGVLRAHGVKAVLIAGLETSVCVLFTATSAYLRRFVPFIVSDACADQAEKHEIVLRMYESLCFKTVTTSQVRNDLASIMRVAEQFEEASSGSNTVCGAE